jgi:hypothetical protein
MANVTTTDKIPAFYTLEKIYESIDKVNDSCADGQRIDFWIAGGSVSDLARGRRFKDIDVFSPKPVELVEKLSRAYGKPYSEIVGMFANFRLGKHTVQIITGYTPASEDEVIELFDFTAVCGAYSPDRFVCHERFWQDNCTRRLVINNLPKPLSTLDRLAKYCRKGFKHCPVGLSRVIKAIAAENIDWDNPSQNIINFYPNGHIRFFGID